MPSNLKGIPLQQRLERQRSALSQERSSFIDHYRELSEWISVRRGRFFTTDRNRGDNAKSRYKAIINSVGTHALRTATAGMLSGTMSPSRPWFQLEPAHDPQLAEFGPVKNYLHDTLTLIYTIFSQSNIYKASPVMLSELLQFGTGCMLHDDDFNDVARFYTQTVGSYYVAQDAQWRVNLMYRDFEMTVEQLVGKFGNRVSKAVMNMYDNGNYHAWRPVVHAIDTNPERDATNPMSRFKKFRSVYFEMGCNEKEVLSHKGFGQFPAYCPRWATTGEDVYGTECPGMIALGDIKMIQIQEKRKAQGIDKMVNPPMRGPASLLNKAVSALPGGVNLYDAGQDKNGVLAPIYTVNPQLGELTQDMERVERRINTAFFVDLFLAISQMEGIQPRNEFDLAQRNQERLLQLGPVLESLHGEFLSPLIERTYQQCHDAGILPPLPEELEGRPLKIKYISTLAQAQRAVATSSIERFYGFIGGLYNLNPNVADKIDIDQTVDEYGSAVGVPPRIIVPDEQAAQARQARAAREQMAENAALAEQAAGIAKTASETNTSGDNLLNVASETIKQRNQR